MKKAVFTLLLISIFFTPSLALASGYNTIDENSYYITTTITDSPTPIMLLANNAQNKNKTITKSKTKTAMAKDGSAIWSITLTATFTYDGSTAKCTKCSHSSTIYDKSWKVKSCSSTKKQNSATTTAKLIHNTDGSQKTCNITLKCSPTGNVS